MTKLIIIGLGVLVLAVMEMVIIVLVHDCQQEDREKGDDTRDHKR